mgnify:CR=1 FL=1
MPRKQRKGVGAGGESNLSQPRIQKKKSIFDDFSDQVTSWHERQKKRRRFAKALHDAYQALEKGNLAGARGCEFAIEALRQNETVTPLVTTKVTAYLNKKVELQIRELVKEALTVQFKDDEPLLRLDQVSEKISNFVEQRIVDSHFPAVNEGKVSLQNFALKQHKKIKRRKHDIQQIRLSQRAVALFDSLIESPHVIFSSQDSNDLTLWVQDVTEFVTSEKQSSNHIPVVTFLTRVNLMAKRDDLMLSLRRCCQHKILSIVEQVIDLVGKCVNDEIKISTLPEQLNGCINDIDEYYGDLLSYTALLSENAFSETFDTHVKQQKEKLKRWIDLALEAGQTYNAKQDYLRVLKVKNKNKIKTLPDALRGLHYVGEPSSSCGVGSAQFFVCIGTLFFAAGIGWSTASLMSLFNSTLPAFFGAITFDAISPVVSSLIIVVTCVSFIALVLGARHLDHHQKATHFYNQFNLFHNNQETSKLETAYNDYQKEKQAKGAV